MSPPNDGFELDRKVMTLFQQPLPGVVLSDVRVYGYSRMRVARRLVFLQNEGLLCVRTVHDAQGEPFHGQLVSLTDLGLLVLKILSEGAVAH